MSRWRFCVISFVYDTHPIHLQRQPRRFAEFPVFLGQPVNSGLCRRGVLCQPCSLLSDLPALDRPHRPLYPPLLLGGLIGRVMPSLIFAAQMVVDMGQLFIGVCPLGYAIHKRVSAVAAVGSLQAVHITQAAHLIDTGVFIPGSGGVYPALPCFVVLPRYACISVVRQIHGAERGIPWDAPF